MSLPGAHNFKLVRGYIGTILRLGKNILNFCDIHALPPHAFTVLSLTGLVLPVQGYRNPVKIIIQMVAFLRCAQDSSKGRWESLHS